jgi:hypothetical protein
MVRGLGKNDRARTAAVDAAIVLVEHELFGTVEDAVSPNDFPELANESRVHKLRLA